MCLVFSAYTSRTYASMSVSVCLSRKCIGALLLILLSNSDPNLPRIAIAVHAGASTELFIVQWARGKGSSPGRVEGSFSRYAGHC